MGVAAAATTTVTPESEIESFRRYRALSVRIGGIFRVQNALHLLEMRDREIRDPLPIQRGSLGDVVGQHIEGLAGRIRLHQYLAGALDGVHVVESLADRVRGYENAVIAHHQPRVVAEQPGEAGAFLRAVSHSSITAIDSEPVEVAGGVLVDRPDLRVGKRRSRGRERRMKMHDDPCLRQELCIWPW